nr:hypothetical protein [Pseudomonas sp.]
MSSYDRPDFTRHVVFKAATEEELLSCLENIPGYDLEPIRGTGRSFSPDQKFLLRSTAGQEIMVIHQDGERYAETSNVFGQDGQDQPTPILKDEVVKLSKACAKVAGLSATPTLSNHDIQLSRTDLDE